MTAIAPGRRYGSLPVTAALAATAGLAFHRVYGWGPVVPVAVVAATVPTLLSAVVSGPGRKPARGGRPLWIAVVLTVAGWLTTCCLTLFRDRLTGGTAVLQAIGSGLRNSWQSILTTLLPVPDRPELLLLAQVAVWLTAFGGAELALRTALRAAPALPALAAFAVALMLGVDGPGSNLPVAAALVLLVAVLALVRSPDTGGGGLRRLLLGAAAALALGGLVPLAGPYLPVAGSPYDLRRQVQAPPPRTRDSVSPLDRISAWLYRPDQPLFTVWSDHAESWRLAVLDRFDGLDWTASGRFMPTGGQVPATAQPGTRRTVHQRFTVQELPGNWVPAADRVRTITGLPAFVDESDGVLAAANPLHSGQTYQVTSSVRVWSTDELAAAVPATDPEATAALALPWGPGATHEPAELAAFRRFAQEATAGALSPIQQAAQLAQWLRGQGRYDVTARPGHNYAQLAWFLCQNPAKGSCQSRLRGTSEHFTTAYAVMARVLGLPTRVVVGFRPGADGGGGLRQVHAGDVLAWPEVKFAGLGWVPFYPTPERAGAGSSDSIAVGETQQKLQSIQRSAATPRQGTGPGRTGATPPPKRPAGGTAGRAGTAVPWWLYPAAGVAVLAAGYLTAVLLVPALRRRRRRGGATPALRIAGAWHQVVEDLGDLGLSGVRTLTAHEVAAFGIHAVGEPASHHLGPLADLVNRTRFAAGVPESSPGPEAADQAWQHTDAIGRLVTRKAGRLRRLRRRLRPQTLALRDPDRSA